LIRKAVEDNLVGYYFVNEAWVRAVPKSSKDDEIVCARCGEDHPGRSTPQCAKYLPALRSGKMPSEFPDRRETLAMNVVTRAGRRMVQRAFHHEGKHIVFDGAAKDMEDGGFNYVSELLAEADRARGAQ
jgi:hypothetical protein